MQEAGTGRGWWLPTVIRGRLRSVADDAGSLSDGAPSAAVRRRAAAEAGHSGDDETVRRLLGDPDPGVRATALGALARSGGLEPEDLTAALGDPDPTVRRRALEETAALGEDPGGRAAGVTLVGLLRDPDPSVVEVAAWACGERRPPEPAAVAELVTLTTAHEDPLVREAAVAALGAIGDPAGLPAILSATHDRATVRRRAVLALAPFEGPEVEAALAQAAKDRDWQVRQAAEDLTNP